MFFSSALVFSICVVITTMCNLNLRVHIQGGTLKSSPESSWYKVAHLKVALLFFEYFFTFWYKLTCSSQRVPKCKEIFKKEKSYFYLLLYFLVQADMF